MSTFYGFYDHFTIISFMSRGQKTRIKGPLGFYFSYARPRLEHIMVRDRQLFYSLGPEGPFSTVSSAMLLVNV